MTQTQTQFQAQPQTQTQPQTQNQSQTQSQTQSQAPISRPQIPSPRPAPASSSPTPVTREVRTRLHNKQGTISITEDTKKEENIAEEIWSDAFSQEQLTKAWNDFVTSYQDKSPVFAAGIKNAEPQKTSDTEIRYKIDNILVIKDQEHLQALHDYLKKALHNNQFILKEEIEEHHKEYVPYTDKDKFEKMASQNPELLKMKDMLGLQINL